MPATELPRRNSLFSAMRTLDWALLTFVSLSLILLCRHFSAERLPWADELLGLRCFAAPDLKETLRGWYEGADGGGLLYYVLGRVWMRLFGLSPLTLRMYSTAGMIVALTLTWGAVRRYASTLGTAFAITIVFFTAPIMLWQEINGRFYGFFLAAAALVAAEYLNTATVQPRRVDYLLTFLGHLLLIGSHILGFVYSFCFLAAMVCLNLRSGSDCRWKLYASGVVAWVLVPMSWHAVHASTSIAVRSFWTQKPGVYKLLFGLCVSAKVPAAALVVLVSLFALLRSWRRSKLPLDASATSVLLALFAAELVLFAKSQTGLSIFSDRYLLPLAVGTTLLLAVLCDAFLRQIPLKPAAVLSSSLAVLLLCAGCFYAASRQVYADLYPSVAYPAKVASQLPQGVPVVTTLLPTFNLLNYFDRSHRYFYETDWAYNNMPEHSSWDFSGERLMENRKRAGYDADRILSCHDMFGSQPDVTLLLTRGMEPWLRYRLLSDARLSVQQIGSNDDWTPFTIWSIHRIFPGPPPC